MTPWLIIVGALALSVFVLTRRPTTDPHQRTRIPTQPPTYDYPAFDDEFWDADSPDESPIDFY